MADQTTGELRTPDEWCRIQGVQVLDPDGWRGRNGRPWADPISLAEFQERLATCTQRVSRNHPWCDAPDCTVCDAGERRTGTLDLAGQGNSEPEPLRSVIDYLTDAAWRVNWKPDDKHSLQARYDALRSLMSIYAYATLVSLETLQRTDPGAADRVAEHLSHDDWDVRAECALLWHESLTGGARYAPFDEELRLLAGHHDPAIRQQVAEEIAQAIEGELDTYGSYGDQVLTRAAKIAREHATARPVSEPALRTGTPVTTDLPPTTQALSKRLPGAKA